MAASIRLSKVTMTLWLLSSFAAALPPAIQPRTTPNTASLASTKTDTTHAAATSILVPMSFLEPSIASPVPRTDLELRSDLATLIIPTEVVAETTSDPTSTITALALPSGFTGVQEWQERWYQTTYWSCVTEAVQTHCGWHEPVLPGGDNSVAGAVLERRPRLFIAAVGAVLAAMGWGGWGGWLF